MDKSPQAVFDKIVAHLRQQGTKSLGSDGGCRYRGADGRMCAVGCLIPDDVYTPELEGSFADIAFFDDWPPDTLHVMLGLQRTHDRSPPSLWEDYFEGTSQRCGLVYTAPETDAEVQS